MELELIDQPTIESRVNQPLVLHPLLILLPFQVKKRRCLILALRPSRPATHYPTNNPLVVPLPQIVLHNIHFTVSCFGGT